jgi:hypothetical protein
MEFHVYPYPPKLHTLVPQPYPLLEAGFSGQQDLSPGADHSMPRQPRCPVQRPHHLPRRSRKTRGVGYVAIGGDFPVGYLPHCLLDLGKHKIVIPSGARNGFSENCRPGTENY